MTRNKDAVKIPQNYIIINQINNKVYIGMTDDLKGRWDEHKRDAKRENRVICRAIRKYGSDNFTIEAFAYYDTMEEAGEAEIFWIAEMRKLLGRENVYNQSDGGEKPPNQKGKKRSDEFKKKLSIRSSGELNHFYGKPWTEEHRIKMSQRMSGGNNPNFGKKASEELLEKNSVGHRGKGATVDQSIVMDIFNSPLQYQEIAELYGTTKAIVTDIKIGLSWSWLTGKKWISARLDINTILNIFNAKGKQKDIAIQYNVPKHTVKAIKRGTSYSKITGKSPRAINKI